MSEQITTQLTGEEWLAAIEARANAATSGPWCTDSWEIYQGTEYVPGISMWIGETCRGATSMEQDRADAAFVAAARTDVPALIAEVRELLLHTRTLEALVAEQAAEIDRLRATLAKYVGKEPTVVEEMAYLNRCLNAVHDLCDEAKRQAARWENPLPVPEWVTAVEQAADGQREDNPQDKRFRIYIDGKGNGWIEVTVEDDGTQYLADIHAPHGPEVTADKVKEDTGSLREIGRCR